MAVREPGAPAPLDILFVGGLPPFQAGSALSLLQLIAGFAGLGHSVRALTPITPDTLEEGEAFAATQPTLSLSWLHLPHLDFTPDIPAPGPTVSTSARSCGGWPPR